MKCAVLCEGDEQRIKDVRTWERKYKARGGMIEATDRELRQRVGTVRAKRGAALGSSLGN
jgi:hypothetical protein